MADRRHPGTGPRALRVDPEGERIFGDFAVLGRDQSKTARSGLEADLVRLEADPPGPDLELASLNSALHASAEVLDELGQDMHRDEADTDRDGEVRFAVDKARTGQTNERCGCTEVRHGQPGVRSMSDATRLHSTAERAGPKEVERGLQEVRRRHQKVRNRDNEVRMQSSTSRLASLEDRAGSMTRRLVTDEVQLQAKAVRFEPTQDRPRMEEASAGHQQVRVRDKKVRTGCKKVRAGCKQVRTRRTEVGSASTEVGFQSSKVRSRSGTSGRQSSKASSQQQTAMFSHINEGILMVNTTSDTNRPVAVLNLPKKSVHGLITCATRIVKAITANPVFPVPHPALATVMAAVADLRDADAKVAERIPDAIVTRDARRAALVTLLQLLRMHVQMVADGRATRVLQLAVLPRRRDLDRAGVHAPGHDDPDGPGGRHRPAVPVPLRHQDR